MAGRLDVVIGKHVSDAILDAREMDLGQNDGVGVGKSVTSATCEQARLATSICFVDSILSQLNFVIFVFAFRGKKEKKRMRKMKAKKSLIQARW